MDRNTAIIEIKTALKRRSGKSWSVIGGHGTAYGWITIDAPPARRTRHVRLKAGAILNRPEDYEYYENGQPGGCITEKDSKELGQLLNLDFIHQQGVSIPASYDYYQEYIDRANGRSPSVNGQPYWD